MTPPPQKETYTISDLAGEFSISTRTIRFWEEKGFILPARRPNGRRVYNRRDRARIKLILRGKRFGHTLDEIMAMIGPGDADMDEREQIRKTLAYGEKSLAEIRARIEEMQLMAKDIHKMKRRLLTRLRALEKGEDHV